MPGPSRPRPRLLMPLVALLCCVPLAPLVNAPSAAPRSHVTGMVQPGSAAVFMPSPRQRGQRQSTPLRPLTPAGSNVCAWSSETGVQATDLNSSYWAANFMAVPNVTYTITGTYPSDRYTSFQAYTHLASDQPIGELLDVNFPPDPGSVNPLLAGTARGTGNYTLHILPGPAPTQTVSGTMYLGAAPGATISVWYRIYLPDTGATKEGNVPLPLLTAHNSADGSGVACPPPLTPIPPGTPTSTPPLGTFIRYPIGAFPNHDNAYLATSLPVTTTLYVVRFAAPTTPHTLAGGIEDINTQLRYWSLCVYGTNFTPITCLPDEQIPLDQQGDATIVMGPTGTQPSNATAGNGVQWIDLGQFSSPDIALIRNLDPAPTFANSAFAVPYNQAVEPYMGAYAPVMVQCDTAQFEADECSSIPTPTFAPTATATPTPPPNFTPSPTPPAAGIVASPPILHPYLPMTITGTNFLAGEAVRIVLTSFTTVPPAFVTTATADATGSFVVTAPAPQDPKGSYDIAATGQSDGQIATTASAIRPLTVLPHSSGGAGLSNVLAGVGFGVREPVRAYWTPGGIPLAPTSGVSTTALGTFAGPTAITFTVPLSPTGTYHIYTIGQISHAIAVSAYTITGTLNSPSMPALIPRGATRPKATSPKATQPENAWATSSALARRYPARASRAGSG